MQSGKLGSRPQKLLGDLVFRYPGISCGKRAGAEGATNKMADLVSVTKYENRCRVLLVDSPVPQCAAKEEEEAMPWYVAEEAWHFLRQSVWWIVCVRSTRLK